LKLDTPIEDISGKKMPAIDIFAHSISFLKNHLWKTLQSRVCGIIETDIQYVITVPAIWDPKAKQFMRRAAYKVQYYGISRIWNSSHCDEYNMIEYTCFKDKVKCINEEF
jgi:hypothetical protein